MWPVQEETIEASTLPMHNVDAQMMRFAYSANEDATQLDWTGARASLAWVRKRIQGRLGGMLEDAVGVLGKLLDGRVIEAE